MKPPVKLHTFIWKGIHASGKQDSGKIKAINKRLACAELSKNKMVVRKIHRKYFDCRKKCTPQEITQLLRTIFTLFTAGIPLLQSLDSAANYTRKQWIKSLLHSAAQCIKQGNPLSIALQQSKIFDDFTCHFIAIGEQSGTLETMLSFLIIHHEKVIAMKAKIKKAILYPTITIGFSMAIMIIMLIFVIPQFESLFASMNALLPWPTRLMLKISRGLIHDGWMLLLIISMGIITIITLKKRYQRVKYVLDKFLLKLPFVGALLKKSIVAQLSRIISTTFSAGMPILETLNQAKSITHHALFQQAIEQARISIQYGESLHHALKKTEMFQNMMLEMVAIGEEAGKLNEMLDKIANIYESEIDQSVDQVSQLLEPIMMVTLGVIIGGLVIAMYLPIFKLGMVI